MPTRWRPSPTLTTVGPLDDLLSLADAAELLGRSPVTLRAAARRGSLEAVLVGSCWVTSHEAVAVYIAYRRRRRLPRAREEG